MSTPFNLPTEKWHERNPYKRRSLLAIGAEITAGLTNVKSESKRRYVTHAPTFSHGNLLFASVVVPSRRLFMFAVLSPESDDESGECVVTA